MKENIPKCFYRVSVKALILDETRTRFLITQEQNGRWELPGGGLDWEENPMDGLSREVKEEMGLNIIETKNTPVYFTTMQSATKDYYYANIIYEVKVADLNFTTSNECVAIKFVSPKEVNEMDVLPNVLELARVFDPKNHLD